MTNQLYHSFSKLLLQIASRVFHLNLKRKKWSFVWRSDRVFFRLVAYSQHTETLARYNTHLWSRIGRVIFTHIWCPTSIVVAKLPDNTLFRVLSIYFPFIRYPLQKLAFKDRGRIKARDAPLTSGGYWEGIPSVWNQQNNEKQRSFISYAPVPFFLKDNSCLHRVGCRRVEQTWGDFWWCPKQPLI